MSQFCNIFLCRIFHTIHYLCVNKKFSVMKILVVDDEQDLCEILQFNLETEGYEVDTANSAEEALSKPLPDYSLFLLDVMMGEMSGFQLARKLKEDPETCATPIIFTTALDGEDSVVKGLNIGADDYIAKPLSMKEVKARVKAVLRRASKFTPPSIADVPTKNTVAFESLKMNIENKTATLNGAPIALTKLEFELLSLFLQNTGKVFERSELIARCWPSDAYVLNRTVDVNITRLRKKIGQYGKHIKTRFGYGYTFEE